MKNMENTQNKIKWFGRELSKFAWFTKPKVGTQYNKKTFLFPK